MSREQILRALGSEGVAEAWEIEIERRVQELENGTVETVPGEEVFRALGRTLRAR